MGEPRTYAWCVCGHSEAEHSGHRVGKDWCLFCTDDECRGLRIVRIEGKQ